MSRKRPSLGLHTRDERARAYSRARYQFEWAVRNPESINFAYGYIMAIYQMALDEVSDDREFIKSFEEMLKVLLENGAQGVE